MWRGIGFLGGRSTFMLVDLWLWDGEFSIFGLEFGDPGQGIGWSLASKKHSIALHSYLYCT
jgi:hypothetical protein